MRIWDNDKGWQDFVDLGGLSPKDYEVLNAALSDFIRKRMLSAWFGCNGGRWAWSAYQQYRRALARPTERDHD